MTRKFVVILTISIALGLFNQPSLSQGGSSYDPRATQLDKERLAFFEKISMQYYGSKEFGPELELVNRFVQLNRTTSHFNLIIPSYEAIASLKYQGSEQLLTGADDVSVSTALLRYGSLPTKFDKTSDTTAWHPSNTLFGLAVLASLLSIGFSFVIYFRYRQKIRALALLGISRDESIQVDRNRLIDYELGKRDEAPISANLAVLQGAN